MDQYLNGLYDHDFVVEAFAQWAFTGPPKGLKLKEYYEGVKVFSERKKRDGNEKANRHVDLMRNFNRSMYGW